ncbi:hypothetical protein DM02DRAFT_583292 [Periconia macrospinosa]|uniref:BTB domain-containing protein n=1 Tax=Periconia macrospinosa TaxID=97972 RepID=A0A2V1E6V5_9PLEO|nr:hypothetical protein DM02DRAFT_583292 [Periconia macrospinosa]
MDDDDLAFLALDANNNATGTVIVLLPDNSVSHIHNVNPLVVLEQCPLLYHAFEFGTHSFPQANIEATSRSAVVSLLRYLYTGDYIGDDRLDTMLNHAQTYKLAEDFDVPALQVSAYAYFTNATERACCFGTPPADLPDTVHFLYTHLASLQSRQEQKLIDTLLNYVLTTFAYHDLGNNEAFLKAIYDIPEFHQDLCRLNMQRDFQDDGKCPNYVCEPAKEDFGFTLVHRPNPGDGGRLWKDESTPSPMTSPELVSKPVNFDVDSDTLVEDDWSLL